MRLAALFAFVGCFPTNGDDCSDNNDSNEKPPVDEYPSGDADGQEENYEYSFELPYWKSLNYEHLPNR